MGYWQRVMGYWQWVVGKRSFENLASLPIVASLCEINLGGFWAPKYLE